MPSPFTLKELDLFNFAEHVIYNKYVAPYMTHNFFMPPVNSPYIERRYEWLNTILCEIYLEFKIDREPIKYRNSRLSLDLRELGQKITECNQPIGPAMSNYRLCIEKLSILINFLALKGR